VPLPLPLGAPLARLEPQTRGEVGFVGVSLPSDEPSSRLGAEDVGDRSRKVDRIARESFVAAAEAELRARARLPRGVSCRAAG